jgi:hypothetical protein
MHPAALPSGADEALGDGGLEALVVIGDDQPDAGEGPSAKRAEELGPERLGFGVAHGAAQHLSLAGGGDAGDHHHRPGDHLASDAALEVGGVGEEVGELDMAERPGPKGRHLLVQPLQVRLTSLLEIPLAAPRAATRSSTLRVDTPCT